MLNRKFHLRLKSSYEGTDNNIRELEVDVYEDHKWKPFSPDTLTPGFLLFAYALFSCQHRYMRVNCAERNIVLESSSGELKLVAGENWDVKSVLVNFNSKLKDGQPAADDISYICERMKHCPVSTNLPDSVDMNNVVRFE